MRLGGHCWLGAGAVLGGGASEEEQLFPVVVEQFGRGADSRDPDGEHVHDVWTIAHHTAWSLQWIRLAAAQAIASTTTIFLDESEALHGLPADPDMTASERRDRLAAAWLQRGPGTAGISAAVNALTPATIETNLAITVRPWDDSMIFHFAAAIGSDAWSNARLRGRVERLLRAMKPSHEECAVVGRVGFRCDDPDSLCDRDALGE